MMDRRSFLLHTTQAAAGAALAAGTVVGAGGAVPAGTAPPNVIWLMADQWRAQALSCNGDPNARTPNVDALAIQGGRGDGMFLVRNGEGDRVERIGGS